MRFEQLDGAIHDRQSFQCRNQPTLEHYFKEIVTQDIKGNFSRCYVGVNDSEKPILIGYYTLSSYSLSKSDIPEGSGIKRRSYLHSPVTLMGRLAVDDRHQRKRYGEALLMDALKRSYDNGKIIGSIAVVLDYIDENARTFYSRYGFIEIPNANNKQMFLPMKTIESLVSRHL